jgi:hypothetical protein
MEAIGISSVDDVSLEYAEFLRSTWNGEVPEGPSPLSRGFPTVDSQSILPTLRASVLNSHWKVKVLIVVDVKERMDHLR